ncbi:IclR family transcriptional regulator [Rhodoglobus vestalii]|uniref:IclR family transcriptional regulator n=1 Tax=Rhodoglobus vestalii TaxID=193384 RepID=A0A8H2K2J9_9MICO|nr:IclR family transcriptional regulator [Rhodoglobus vestalii]TQO18538.1 IclR family transcriptional regulator [Rhodoglobus vestalii]
MNELALPVKRRNSSGLRRDLELLEALSTQEAVSAQGLGVVRLAEISNRDKGQVSRTLATLADAGLVSRDPYTLAYRLGHQLYAMAARTAEAQLAHIAVPFLRRIVSATHETTHLCVLRGGSVLTLSSELSEYAFRGLGWEGVSTSIWRTSAGRVLVSTWGNTELSRVFETNTNRALVTSPIPQIGSATRGDSVPASNLKVTNATSLVREIELIRSQGYATVDEEFEIGVVGVSAPVYDFRGNLVAALNISAPKARLGGHLDEAGIFVARVAKDFSATLACSDKRTPA